MPAAINLFHVSDLHFGAEDRAALDWFADEVARHRPDGVICTGDLTMRGRAHEFAAACGDRFWVESIMIAETCNYLDPMRQAEKVSFGLISFQSKNGLANLR